MKKNSSYWTLEFKALDGQGGEISKLENKNGVTRVFKTKESALQFGQELGFENIIVDT